MDYTNIFAIFAPSIALLILSTTMRLGNVRMAVIDIVKAKLSGDENNSKYIFIRRAHFLSLGLRYLTLSFLVLVLLVVLHLFAKNFMPYAPYIINMVITTFFVLLLIALISLYRESRLVCQSIDTLGNMLFREDTN